jgi:hypothetical protein
MKDVELQGESDMYKYHQRNFFMFLFIFLILHSPFLILNSLAVQLPKTGQTTSYAAGDDGALKRGVAWPGQRFSDHGNGAVTDSLTGLMWVKNANLMATRDPGFDTHAAQGDVTWQRAFDYVRKLNSDRYLGYSDWRLPNRKELRSLIDYSQYAPSLPVGHPFTNVNVQAWSSSTYAYDTGDAWVVSIWDGVMDDGSKSYGYYYVWPVRAGQSGSFVHLTITKDGSGLGSVTANSGTISWSGNTGTAGYLYDTQVILSPNADVSSLFGGWSGGGCSGTGNCTVTMHGDITVAATFNLKPARIAGSTPVYFTTLKGAHNGAVGGDTIDAEGIDFPESLTVSKPLSLIGGYDSSYSANSGFTMVEGLTITGGSLTVENLQIK